MPRVPRSSGRAQDGVFAIGGVAGAFLVVVTGRSDAGAGLLRASVDALREALAEPLSRVGRVEEDDLGGLGDAAGGGAGAAAVAAASGADPDDVALIGGAEA